MALTTPILYSQVAFDATSQQVFAFSVIGGDQVVANTLTIIKQSTSEVVYQEKQTTYLLQNTVPANTLVNGVYYTATVKTWNANNVASSESSPIQFWCYSAPTFALSNIPAGGLINNESYTFTASYTQAQSELLNSYSFNLYNSERIQIATSGVKYTTATALPISVSHMFTGLNDETIYYVSVNGVTAQGTVLTGALTQIYVKYSTPSVYSTLELSNNCEEGYITVSSNITTPYSYSNPSPPEYYLVSGTNYGVDVTDSGTYVKWDGGFSIDGDFTAMLWTGETVNTNKKIITFADKSGNTIEVYFYYSTSPSTTYGVYCYINCGGTTGFIYDTVQSGSDLWKIWIRRKGSYYDVRLLSMDEEEGE